MAVSDDPERNGISRLDEMMSGVVGVDMLIEWFVYCIRYNSYVLQIVDVAPLSFRVELTARCCCALFYNQLASKVTRTRLFILSATWCRSNTSVSSYSIIIDFTSTYNRKLRVLCFRTRGTLFPRIVVGTTILFLGFRCDNYSRETIIQGRKLLISIIWVVYITWIVVTS